MLFQRGNLFLVAESLLVVSYASMLGVGQTPGSDRPTLAARVIAVFGLLLTLAWGYVGHRHLQYCSVRLTDTPLHALGPACIPSLWPEGAADLRLPGSERAAPAVSPAGGPASDDGYQGGAGARDALDMLLSVR